MTYYKHRLYYNMIALLRCFFVSACVSAGLTGCASDVADVDGAPVRGAVHIEPRSETAIETKVVKVSFSGDILIHGAIYKEAKRISTVSSYSFDPMLNGINQEVNADINICHLETILADKEPSAYPRFSTPVELAGSLRRSGFHGCSTASNHSLDYGIEGVASTIDALEANYVKHTGTRKNKNDASYSLYTFNGVTIAHLSYTFSTNGMPVVYPWSVNMLSTATILRESAQAKRVADVVVVSIHFGTEYSTLPDSLQKSISGKLTLSPNIDAIIGHHAHVIQPQVTLNGKPVFYGLGNLLSAQEQTYAPSGNMGVVVTLKFTVNSSEAVFSGYEYLPTIVNSSGWKIEVSSNVSLTRVKLMCLSIENANSLLGIEGTLNAASKNFYNKNC